MNRPDWLIQKEDFYDVDWLNEYLPDLGVFCDEYCYSMAELTRFEELPYTECPKCKYVGVHYDIEENTRYKCVNCLHKFSITSGTYIGNTKIGLHYWFRIAYLLGKMRFPINSVLMSYDLCLTQKTTYTMLVTIKQALELKGNGIKYTIPKSITSHKITTALLQLNQYHKTKNT